MLGKMIPTSALILLALFGSIVAAQAQCSSYPYTLTNGTTANATQVMSNFNCAALTSGATINAATLTGTTTLPGSGAITSSGSVGIGTTSPAALLNVVGGTGNLSTVYSTDNNAYSTSSYAGINSFWLSNQSTTAGTGSGIGFAVKGAGPGSVATIAGISTASDYSSALIFMTRSSGGTDGEKMRITASGNVGIGTTSPSNILDIIQSASANGRLKSTSSGSASLSLDGATGQASELYNYINGTPYWSSGITGNGAAGSYDWYSYAGSQSVFYLQSNGNAALTGCLVYNGGTLGTCLSDERIKKNIRPFKLGLSGLIGLQPVSFEYNGLGDVLADRKIRTGLIAQQVQQFAPELVLTTKAKLRPTDPTATPLLEVKYADLTFALINAVKELKAANDNQTARIEHLEERVATLQRKLGIQTAQK